MVRAIRVAALLALLGTVYAVLLSTGCTPSDKLGGVEVINAVPETYITGTPPYLRATDFFVEFHWSGTDPDGRVEGYEWKMSTNGDDGISVYDTLTVDPATGDTINPWNYTTSTDSVFFVTADSSSFADDSELPENLRRFYQPHTLFVRAVDDKGQVDPTPAMLTFTATTFAPTVYLTAPPSLAASSSEAKQVPPTFTVKWSGSDPDLELGIPTKVRYLLKDALYTNLFGDEVYLSTFSEYRLVGDTLVTFDEPGWSDWIPYVLDPDARAETFERPKVDDQGRRKMYFFAIQAQDTAGAVSLDRSYGGTVKNFYVNDVASPTINVRERYLGAASGTGYHGRTTEDIAQGQPLNFEWTATATSYGAEIAGYRYGWDVEDLNDDGDDGWVTQFGLTESHQRAQEKVFDSGSHVLTIEVRDNSGLESRYTYVLNVVPVPDAADQLPLLLIDGVSDRVSDAWQDENGYNAWDNDIYRDDFWAGVLDNVTGFNFSRDVIDNEVALGEWGYRDAVPYRNLVWTSRKNNLTYIPQHFQGRYIEQGEDEDPLPVEAYVWLETYQQKVGNVFLCGSGIISNFHLTDYDHIAWLYPIIYTADDSYVNCAIGVRARSFGTRDETDGSVTVLGTVQYPYRALGLSVHSLTQPRTFYLTPSNCGQHTRDFKLRCVGTKGVILNPEFKDNYIGGSAFPDTIYTWDVIDWEDHEDPIPEINQPYVFGSIDDFFNVNVTPRPTSWNPQVMADGTLAIEPMWHMYTRYDYILDQQLASGNLDYPDFDPADICGSQAVNEFDGRTVTDGVPLGVFTYKSAPYKPSGTADVIWGFDPHRMDHDGMSQAILWVLGEHFGLPTTGP